MESGASGGQVSSGFHAWRVLYASFRSLFQLDFY